MSDTPPSSEHSTGGLDFVRTLIEEHNKSGRFDSRVHTRFPPEPNGYLHIGHAKSICLNFGLAAEYKGKCNLRFDDTNPTKEETEYVDAIREDVRWLGFDWEDREFYASDYFQTFYELAVQLIEAGKAYVDSLSAEEIRQHRGTLTEAGTDSPYRERSIATNLELFMRMRKGDFADGEHVLRAKINMASPNMVMRDPTLYRIRKTPHHRTGDAWPIYPMYDFAHCISDSLENITQSLCSLEFENNRALYDWLLDALGRYRPQQIEFARLNLSYTMLSKRKLIQLVTEGHVHGWDDPRMPTLSGLRRRGYPAVAIREFCARIGLSRSENMVDYAFLEFCAREQLNASTPRVMAVLDPIKVIIENYPEGQEEWLDAPYHPDDARFGSRKIPFARELYIERDDFRETAPKKFFRLAPGKEVRLRYGYYITCTAIEKDADGTIHTLRCRYDPETKGGDSPDGRRVRGTLHWVSAAHAIKATARLYEQLFTEEKPAASDRPLQELLNPQSRTDVTAFLEPALAQLTAGEQLQFERLGYFCVDPDSRPDNLVFNRTVGLRDSWAKIEQKLQNEGTA